MNRFVILLVIAVAAITYAEAGGINGLKNKLKAGLSGRFATGRHSSSATAHANSYGSYKTAIPSYGSHGQTQYSYSDGLPGDHYGDKYSAGKSHGAYDKYSSGAYGNKYSGQSDHHHGGHGDVTAAVADAHVSDSGVAIADAAAYGANGASSATAAAINSGVHGSHGHGSGHNAGYDYDDDYSYGNHGGHSVSHGAPVVPPPRPVAPMRPTASIDSYKNLAYTRPAGRYARPHGVATAASAVSGIGGGAASTSTATAGLGGAGHSHGYGSSGYYPESHVSQATAGTYSNSDHGRESSAYKRATEHLQEQEDGHRDDNHYYKSDTYGKAEDENLYEANNYDDEDIEQTPTVFRSKKSSGNYVKDYNKNRRETGSGVLAKDKHSSGFSRNVNRFNEDVDQRHSREGDGIIENSNHVSTHSFDDGDEEIYDSDGFGHPAHLHGPRSHGGSASASSAVASGPGGSAIASSASTSG